MRIQVRDSTKNLIVQVSGFVEADTGPKCILDLDSPSILAPKEGWKGLRLDAAVWALQEKMGFLLSWDTTDEGMCLVLESRNSMRFDQGVHSPRVRDGWEKMLYLSAFKVDERKAFFLILDFDKQ